MRHLALADLTDADIRAMLVENETLFVEHKTGIGGDGFQIAKAVCSFANTLGGWLLIGVTEGKPNAGSADGWQPLAPHAMTDRVRETLVSNRVDPIPPFAATVIEYGDAEQAIGVVRIYESSDTPHVMSNGQVFVRSVAMDRDLGRVYRPGGVETQAALLELADRGRIGVERAREKLIPDRAPYAAMQIGISPGHAASATNALVGLRAIPVTVGTFADWAVSKRGYIAVDQAARILSRRTDGYALNPPELHASGLSVSSRSENLMLPEVEPTRDGVVTVATDAAGIVVAAIRFGVWTPSREPTRLTLNGVRDAVFVPLLGAVCSVLDAAEAYGRVILELRIGRLEQVITVDDEGGFKTIPSNLPLGGELTLPLSPDGIEIEQLANRWRADAGRAAGYMTLLP